VSTNEKEKVAMFRYAVIAPLICRRFENKGEEREARAEILSREFIHPDGGTGKIPERTLREWQLRYRRYGLDGLYDGLRKDRKNKGRYRAIKQDALNRAEQLKRELPERSAEAIMELLKQENKESIRFSSRTLQRHLKLRKSSELHQRWEQMKTNDLWHGDTAHAVWLPDPINPNKMKRTKLIAFVDDASRICTHGEFYFDEKLPSLVDTFSKALLKRGKPRRLLLDNAFIFHSTTLEVMCAELETELSFCRPRRPQGKGKIERLIRTIKDSFVNEANRAGFTSLEELNQAFRGWLEIYHNRRHSELRQTPNERWSRDEGKVTGVTPEHIRRALMLRTTRRVQEQTGTIFLDGLEYSCSKEVAGKTVEVRWHVDVTESIEVWLNGRFIEKAWRSVRPTTLPYQAVIEEENYPTINSAKVRMEYLRRATGSEAVGPRMNEFLTVAEFTKMVARYLERALAQPELEKLSEFFRSYAPLQKNDIEAALKKAISVKGSALHLRYYLEHVEKAVQGRRK
jgi:putative transposase